MSAVNSILNLLRFNKGNWRAVVLCVMAATVFWFFNALNKTYTTLLSFPIEFQYDQDNFIPVSDLPIEVKMNVTGMGWTLIRRSAGVKVPALLLPLERPTETKKIVGSTLPILFSNQIADLQINFVATDTLTLDIEPFDGRWLPVMVDDLNNNLRPGFGLASTITLTPDSIFIQGPRRIVEALRQPYPVMLPTRNIDEPQELVVTIPLDHKRLAVDPAQINVSFRIEKLAEVRDSVKVDLINLPARIRTAININQIHYTLQLPESTLYSYSRENIRATLDLKNLKERRSRISPTITGIPPFSKIIKIDTVEIAY